MFLVLFSRRISSISLNSNQNFFMRYICFVVTILFSIVSIGQVPLPSNGLPQSSPEIIVLKNAKILVSPTTTIEKGTLIIKEGKIDAVGALVATPKGAVEIDMKGKTIVPSFIEVSSSIGLPEVSKKEWSPRPQIESSREGAFHWNDAIRPEQEAASDYKANEKEAKKLLKMGIGFAVTHHHDGIIRGSGAMVALGNVPEEKAIIHANVGLFFSFNKGSSKQSYPSSLTGSIALLRQTLYDAQYYADYEHLLPVHLSLQKFNQQWKNVPHVFDVNDGLDIFRAQKIMQEFDTEAAILGSGKEYTSLDRLKNWTTPLFIPINFPEAYDVKDPLVARQIPLSDLKDWELAPSNPYLLEKENINFGITSRGHDTPEKFWNHLHQALERGLSPEKALEALTLTPARYFQLEEKMGSLEEGKLASFSVFDHDPFIYKNAVLLENWSLGKVTKHSVLNEVEIRGTYSLSIAGKTGYYLTIEGEKEKPKGKVQLVQSIRDSITSINKKDTLTYKASISQIGNDVSLHFNAKDAYFNGALTLHGKINEKLGVIEGQGAISNGEWHKWAAIKSKKHTEKETIQPIKIDSLINVHPYFPNMAYGFEQLPENQVYVLRNATLWTNEEQGIVNDGTVILKDGKISFVGKGDYIIPGNAIEINAKGMHITSGIIDEHSHIALSRGVNEGGQSNSAEVRMSDVVRNDDINIYRQLSGGVTAAQLLHGSANAIGGQSALIKMKWGHTPDEMLITDSPKFIKFALGENVKQSNWGDFQTIRFPQTRMGVEQVFYSDFLRAKVYGEKWNHFNSLKNKEKKNGSILPPARDLELETVLEILNGERHISCHSYIQSEINMLMHVADSLGFTVNTFTHILEGYKVADKMKEHGAGASTFSDWWGYKFEVNDAIPFNAALMHEQGLVVAINSDDAEMGRRLNQEAAKAMKYGGVSEQDAWKMVTLNPAKLLHLDDRMGSLKVGKDADVVIWSDHPLSINAKVVSVFIDGKLMYDYRNDERMRARNRGEKARIINKMLADNEAGKPSKTFIKKDEKHWHCDTIGEHEGEHHEH